MNGTNPSGSKRTTGSQSRDPVLSSPLTDPDLSSPLTDSLFRTFFIQERLQVQTIVARATNMMTYRLRLSCRIRY